VPAVPQRKMEQGQHLPLHFRFEVDQQIATADQIEPGERWVLE
jgi:hypothetical protein